MKEGKKLLRHSRDSLHSRHQQREKFGGGMCEHEGKNYITKKLTPATQAIVKSKL